jgi:hypothetical protein
MEEDKLHLFIQDSGCAFIQGAAQAKVILAILTSVVKLMLIYVVLIAIFTRNTF